MRAVTPATGIAAACTCWKEAGFRATVAVDIVAYSANVPSPWRRLPTEPNTSSPIDRSRTPSPIASTVPDASPPGISGNRCSIWSLTYPWITATSNGFNPAAATRMRT